MAKSDKPDLPVSLIKSAILDRLRSGRAPHETVKTYIRQKYPQNTLRYKNFNRAVRELVSEGKITDANSRLSPKTN